MDSSNGSLVDCGAALDCAGGVNDDGPGLESEAVELGDVGLGASVGDVAAVGAVLVGGTVLVGAVLVGGIVLVGGTLGSTVGETVTAEPSGATGAPAVLALLVAEVPFVDASPSEFLLLAHAAKTNVTKGMVKRRIRFI